MAHTSDPACLGSAKKYVSLILLKILIFFTDQLQDRDLQFENHIPKYPTLKQQSFAKVFKREEQKLLYMQRYTRRSTYPPFRPIN